MNSFIEDHGRFDPEEFMRLVNEKLIKHAPAIEPITLDEAIMYHDCMGLSVETVVDEHLHVWHVYG